jgi:hypothetical protein
MAKLNGLTYAVETKLAQMKDLNLFASDGVAQDAQMTVELFARMNIGMVYVDDYEGVDPTGTTNSTAGIAAAIADLPDGKGVLVFGKGTYLTQGMPANKGIYYFGQGRGVTNLQLPPSPTNHVLASTETGEIDVGQGGGVANFTIQGQNPGGTRSSYNGIDMATYDVLYDYVISRCQFQFLRCGIRGSQDDRFFIVDNCQFTFNDVGQYIEKNQPQYSGFNVYYSNTYAIGGYSIYDVQFPNMYVYSNQYGLWPLRQDGRPAAATSTINGTGTPGTDFYPPCMAVVIGGQWSNRLGDMWLGNRCIVSSCAVMGDNGATKTSCIKIGGYGTRVENCIARDDGIYPFTGSWISLVDDWSSSTLYGVSIKNNWVRLSGSGTGGFVKDDLSASKFIRGLSIEGNTVDITGSNGFLFSSGSSSTPLYNSSISRNSGRFTNAASTRDIIYVAAAGNRLGNQYDGNLLEFNGGGRWHINVPQTEATLMGNTMVGAAKFNSVSITSSGTTATIPYGTNNSLAIGDRVFVGGASNANFNGNVLITGVTATTATYTLPSDQSGATATGARVAWRQGINLFGSAAFFGNNLNGNNTYQLCGGRDTVNAGNLVQV